MTRPRDDYETAEMAIVSSSIPTAARLDAFRWGLSLAQNAAVQSVASEDAQAFGRAARWTAQQREKYLRELKLRMNEIDRELERP